MKRIISILTLASILMMSCKKDFLEITPISSVTTDLVYKTDKDFQDAVIGTYYKLTSFYRYFWQFGDLPGDDVTQEATWPTQIAIDQFAVDVNEPLLKNAWSDLYQTIATANLVLSEIEKADSSIVTNKQIYIGEAKFIRALAYFDLVRIFGDIPMITAPITILESLEIKRTNVNTIYDEVIIKDLLAAEIRLPVKHTAANLGRATQGAAKSLLGLVYLTRKDFIKSEAKLLEVTSLGYALLGNFNDLFNFNQEHHSEYIFDIEYIEGNVGLGSNFTQQFLLQSQYVGAALVNAIASVYNIQTPAGGGVGTPSLKLIALFDNNDLRKYRTATTGIFDLTGKWVTVPPGSVISAFSQKYYTSLITDGKANWRIVRYADVLLMLAEAMNENGKTNEALTNLNKVHTRAGLPAFSGLTQTDTREKIYLERRFELFMEGSRWFDLVRTGRALSVMAPYGMKSHNTIFPIPQSQIEVVNNPEILSQNPGY